MPDQASSAAATARLERITSQLAPDVFRTLGHDLVDRIADFLNRLPSLLVTPGESPEVVRALLPTGSLPEQGAERGALLAETTEMLFAHSLFNGHPRFFGYITSSPAPMGMLADLLVAAVNQNVAFFSVAPVATEIEAQAVRWDVTPPDLALSASPHGKRGSQTHYLAELFSPGSGTPRMEASSS